MLILQNTVTRAVAGVCFGPDGRTLIAGGSGGFDVWDLTTSQHTFTRGPSAAYLWIFHVDPTGQRLYVSDNVGQCRFYDRPFTVWRRLPLGGDNHAISLATSPDGARMALSRGGAGVNRLECWQAAGTEEPALAWSRTANGLFMFHGVAFHPDGSQVAAVERVNGPIVLRDAITGGSVTSLGTIPYLLNLGVAFTPDARHILSWDQRQVDLWILATGRRAHHLVNPGRAYFTGLAIHPGGEFFATAAGDGCVRLWSLPECEPGRVLKWEIGKLHSIAFSRDGMLAAAGGSKGQVVVWDVDADR
jgi:WD40 repeat protein